MQVDRFEDTGVVVLFFYPDGRWGYHLPRELLPEDARPGDVFEVSFVHDRRETELRVAQNKELLDDLLGRDG